MAKSKTAGETGDKTIIELLRLDDIDDQNIIQLREKQSEATVQEYADIYGKHPKGTLPPIVVFRTPLDDQRNLDIVADGDHRVRAARVAGLKRIEAEIRYGNHDAAVLYACGCNARHGLRRTNADKRIAVLYLLGRQPWAKKADRWIAEKCGVSHTFVANVRDESGLATVASEREGRDGRKIKTANIGRRKAATPGVATKASPGTAPTAEPATVPAPHDVDKLYTPDEEPPLCPVCEVRNVVDGERCQECIDAGLTGDEEEALQAQAGVASPDVAAATPRRRSPDKITNCILDAVGDGKWRTAAEIADAAEYSEGVVQFRLTAFGKGKMDGVFCQRRRAGKSWQYRIVRTAGKKIDMELVWKEARPILDELKEQGQQTMATMSPGSVLVLAHRLEQLFADLMR